jgi:CHASE3 domain sensor protein
LRLLRRSAVPASVGALLLICAVIPLSVRQLATLVETRAGVDHTRRVIERLDEFLIDLDEAESQQRLYIITGDTLLRDSSGEALTVATHQINALATLTVDNAGQAPRLARLRRLTAARFNLMDSVNSLRVRGRCKPAAALEPAKRSWIASAPRSPICPRPSVNCSRNARPARRSLSGTPRVFR